MRGACPAIAALATPAMELSPHAWGVLSVIYVDHLPTISVLALSRSRGEQFHIIAHRIRGDGSSPLTRGAPVHRGCFVILVRLIPAHAGSTVTELLFVNAHAAHPRSRGEHGGWAFKLKPVMGSSPLTRGALRALRASCRFMGLIPAHAGSTTILMGFHPPPPAHPRSRGEHRRMETLFPRGVGSSPLTRGAHLADAEQAGMLVGSSPLTRGAQALTILNLLDAGLIPAHAGSTGIPSPSCGTSAAHPRSRGEHRVSPPACCPKLGSSPLTRGARFSAGPTTLAEGLIPAHAGSTETPHKSESPPSAHPRSRGEHSNTSDTLARLWGSSPLTRGARSSFFELDK